MIQFNLISEISVCMHACIEYWVYWNAGHHCWVLDIICVWVLVVAALMAFCFLCGCQQGETLLSKTNASYLSCQTPAYVEEQSTD